jgi:fatty acid desaturase
MSEVISVERPKNGRSKKHKPSWQTSNRQCHDGAKGREREVNPQVFVWKLIALSFLVSVCIVGIRIFDGMEKFILMIVMGLLLAHSTELVHQCLHRLATGKSAWDHALGMALGYLSGVSFWNYLWFHLWHHKHNGTKDDMESFGYVYQLLESPSRAKRIFGFAYHLSMIGHYVTALRRMESALRGRLAGKLQAENPAMIRPIALKIQRDYVIMAGLLVAAISVSVAFQTWLVVEVWLVPLLIAWGPVHALIELPEHWACDRPCADPFANTRTIQAGLFARWFTNNNCNHVGHHYDMSVPMERLPAYEESLMLQHNFKHMESSYHSFYWRFLKLLVSGRRPQGDA